ncbi:MAG: hypothetical protein AAGC56_05840 [Pseudomonadota bacterium]
MKLAKPTPLIVIGAFFLGSVFVRTFEVVSASAAPAPEDKLAEKDPAPAKSNAAPSKDDAMKSAEKAPDDPAPEKTPTGSEKSAPMKLASAETAAARPPVPDLTRFETAEPSSLLAEIRARSAALDAREAEIRDRERTLEILEGRLDEKITSLKQAKTDLEARLAYAETAAKEDITKLARMYENMKPARAGEIFNAMTPTFAAGFLTEMNSESAAQILTNMETKKAYAASVIIAGRNADVHNAPRR